MSSFPLSRINLGRLLKYKVVFKRWETSPLRPQERTQVQGLLEIGHPSLEDLKNTLEDLDLYIQRTETRRFRDIAQAIRSQEADPKMCFVDPRDRNWYNTQRQASETLRRQRDKVRSFIERETYTLGPVFAGSELWRSQNHTYRPFILDWALIEIPEERRGTNTVSHCIPALQNHLLITFCSLTAIAIQGRC